MSNFDEDFFKELLKEEREECLKGPGIDLDLHEAFVDACQQYQDAKEALDAATADLHELQGGKKGPINLNATPDSPEHAAAIEMMSVWMQSVDDATQRCREAAEPILESINLSEYDDLEMSLLRTAIMTRQTCKGLAKFASESDLHGQLIETLLNSKKLMKEMILHGGANDHHFGQAMKLYTQIMAKLSSNSNYDHRYTKLHKRLSMAAALEFTVKKYEFDTSKPINPVSRVEHYARAHRKGELDPAFAHLRTWEFRLALNNDAPDEQLAWGRTMLQNFAPHIVSIYDEKWRYNYIVTTDVGYRSPKWTSSPRTYQQVLSGGGREGPRAWFGRFICQAFGVPVWGVRQFSHVAMTRWTPKGWQLCFGNPLNDWSCASWDNRSGHDFLEEAKARSAVTEQEYFEKVILLECLSDACKEQKPVKKSKASSNSLGRDNFSTSEDATVHPDKVWRSLAAMQRKIFAEQSSEESFGRTGQAITASKIEKLIGDLDSAKPPLPFGIDDEDDTIIIPAASFTSSNGKQFVKTHPTFGSDNGTQVHLVKGESEVTYYLPKDIPVEPGTPYMLQAEVCTVHAVQFPLHVQIDDDKEYEISIPYTVGEWQTTEPIEVQIDSMSTLRFFRTPKKKSCFGLAIKSFTLTPAS